MQKSVSELVPALATETGSVFVLPAPALPWLGPCCILIGIGLQLGVLLLLRLRRRGMTVRSGVGCGLGALLVFAGAALDADVTVAVGEVLALAAIRFAWRAP